MSGSNCCFLTCIQVSQEAGKVVWYSHLFKNFPQLVVIHTVKGFNVVNEVEVDIFLELPCFLHDPTNVGNLISGSSAFSFCCCCCCLFFILIGGYLLYNIVVVFAIHSHESAMSVHVFIILTLPPTSLRIHPSGSSEYTSPEHPATCIKPRLVIYFTYDNIHASMLFSQIIPPSPSPTESNSLFSICVSFAISHIGSLLTSF